MVDDLEDFLDRRALLGAIALTIYYGLLTVSPEEPIQLLFTPIQAVVIPYMMVYTAVMPSVESQIEVALFYAVMLAYFYALSYLGVSAWREFLREKVENR